MLGKKVKNGAIEDALNRFLKEKDKNKLVIGFEDKENGVFLRAFGDHVENFSLFNPFFGINNALHFRRLFSKGTKIILLLRPCEIRAYVELIKLSQIEREDIIAVSIDCPGTISSKSINNNIPLEAKKLKEYLEGNDMLRWACKTCREKRGVVGDAGIRIDQDGFTWAVPYNNKGDDFLSLIDGELEEINVGMLISESKRIDKFQSEMDKFYEDFSKCIMCKNCRDMCPVCYCIDCVFNGDEYLPKGDALLNKILRSGTVQLPQGKELFHFIRMYHVSQTCVGCGACEEACPQGIPLTRYFKGISERLQDMFSYMSGRDFEESIPYLTFIEDELKDAAD